MKPFSSRSFTFNLFDFFILCILIALIVLSVIYFSPAKKESSPAVITFSFSGLRNELIDLFHEGDMVYDKNGSTEIGLIQSIFKEPDLAHVTDPQTGETNLTPYPEGTLYRVTIVLKAIDAVPSDTGCTIGSVSISPNEAIALRTAFFSGSASCVNIIFGGAL